MGDVIFDPSQAASAGIMPEATGERAVEDDYSLNDFDSRGIARQYFRYLPFTATELKEISQTFGNSGVYSAVRENASEKRLREMCAKSPDVLHLATHGFFISSETDAMRVPFMRRYSSQIGSPMQRSGVALANAGGEHGKGAPHHRKTATAYSQPRKLPPLTSEKHGL